MRKQLKKQDTLPPTAPSGTTTQMSHNQRDNIYSNSMFSKSHDLKLRLQKLSNQKMQKSYQRFRPMSQASYRSRSVMQK
jgi:hypothetical protein